MNKVNKEDLVLKLIGMLVVSDAPEEVKSKSQSSFYDQYAGKHVIVRSRNEGINFGTVKVADNTGIVLSDCRRIWYHKPANNDYAWYYMRV